MPLTASFGVFPATNSASAMRRTFSQGDMRKTYFTTSNQEFYSGRPADKNANESLSDVHRIGEKQTEYMDWQPSKAPLKTRSSCKYNQDFSYKPLGDHIINRDAADFNKGPGPVKSAPTWVKTSKTTETYAGQTTDELKWARGEPAWQRFARTSTIGGVGESLEHVSEAQREHSARGGLSSYNRAKIPRPLITFGAEATKDTYRSSYSRNFSGR